MKIGIELRQIALGPCGGIVPLLQGVLEALFAHWPEHDVFLFCTKANNTLLPAVPSQVRVLTLPEEGYWARVDAVARAEGIEVLLRSYPLDAPLGFPPSKQVVLVPDLQHEFFPEFFAPDILATRRASFDNALQQAGAIATLSEHARRTVRDHPATRCPDVFLMSPALRTAVERPCLGELAEEERALLPTRPYFLFPANLWPHKNHRRVLEAFGQFHQRSGAAVELVLTGHPSGWAELAAEHPALPVRHLGFVRRAFLQLLLERAEALLFFTLFEGFGMPLLEAFEAGTPVLCSNTTSLPEVGGDAVLSCDPTDPGAMSELMARATSEEGLRGVLAARGKERLALYSWRQSAANLVEAFSRVASNGPPPWEVPWLVPAPEVLLLTSRSEGRPRRSPLALLKRVVRWHTSPQLADR